MSKGRNRNWLTAGFCILAVFAVLLALSFFVPLYGEICGKDEYTGAKDCAPYHIVLVMLWHVTKAANDYGAAITALATVAVAAFTFTLYEATTKQGELTLRSVELARDEFISTHRPRIILRGAIISSVLEGEKISIFFILANVGETPGKIVNSVVDVEIINKIHPGRYGLTSLEPFNEIGEIELAPGRDHLFAFKDLKKRPRCAEEPVWSSDTFGPKQQIVQDPSGRHRHARYYASAIHLVGQFLYEDRGGIRRRTAFRRELDPGRQRFYRIEDEPDLDYAD